MKKYEHYLKTRSAAVLLFIIGLLASVKTWAQDRDVDININSDGGAAWYQMWWVWAVGLALFIIIIVAIVSAGKKT